MNAKEFIEEQMALGFSREEAVQMYKDEQAKLKNPQAPAAATPKFTKGEELSFALSANIVNQMETKPLVPIYKRVVVSCSTDGETFYYQLAKVDPVTGNVISLMADGVEIEESAIVANLAVNSGANRSKVF